METWAAVFRRLVKTLSPVSGEREARATARALFQDAFDQPDPAGNQNILTAEDERKLADFTRRLADDDEPLAYLTGIAHFYDMIFSVNRSVLIPRPETEEMVHRIIGDWSGFSGLNREPGLPLRILDVGTGSGCIALALARNLPFAEITALDISREALKTARENAARYNLLVHFVQGDFLESEFRESLPEFDLLVSNPPYISVEERPSLERRVRAFEPHEALFAPAEDPLAFYRAASTFAREKMKTRFLEKDKTEKKDKALQNTPVAYLETSEHTAAAAQKIWDNAGFLTQLHRDLSGRDRVLVAY